MRLLAAALLALLLLPTALAERPSPPLPDVTLVDHRDGTYVLLVDTCGTPVLGDCLVAVPLPPRAPGVFPTVEQHGLTVYTSLDCQHYAPTYGVRESECSSVSLSPTARVTPRSNGEDWFWLDVRACAHYTGWGCAWNGPVPVPDPRDYVALLPVRDNGDGSYTVGEDCRVAPTGALVDDCPAAHPAFSYPILVPERTYDGVTTRWHDCRTTATPPTHACTQVGGQGPNAHVGGRVDDDGSLDPYVRVCALDWWCQVNEQVDLPRVLP